MSAEPRLSVVLPVHDAETHLRMALTSILEQAFTDFEVIVVDDHSTDGSLEIVRELAAHDRRLRVVVLDEQLGVGGALNVGLARVTAPLVGRMDADDIARPERFAVQVAEMERDTSLGLLGSQIEVIGHDGAPEPMFPWALPLTHDETVWQLLFGTPICHPTVVMRTDVVRDLGGYDPGVVNEDMELWTRMAFVARMRNVDAVLLEYRMPAAVHAVKLAGWQPHITRVGQRYLERIVGVPVAEAVVLALRGIASERAPDDIDAALTNFAAASLLVHAYDRMRSVGVLSGDGLESVSGLVESHVQELAARAHVLVAGRV
ncbi:MAG TPA: glycosyltransferase [Aeromicrobium sp.]|nr:glycosyltransferase [Aeromicrobium sp.]